MQIAGKSEKNVNFLACLLNYHNISDGNHHKWYELLNKEKYEKELESIRNNFWRAIFEKLKWMCKELYVGARKWYYILHSIIVEKC